MATHHGPANQEIDGHPGSAGGELTSVRFAAMARRLSDTARDRGLIVPAFRSPPKVAGLRRSIRRGRDGSATVSVALRNRPAMAVAGDMIDGIVAAAGLSGVEAGAARDELWQAVGPLLIEAPGFSGGVAPGERLAA